MTKVMFSKYKGDASTNFIKNKIYNVILNKNNILIALGEDRLWETFNGYEYYWETPIEVDIDISPYIPFKLTNAMLVVMRDDTVHIVLDNFIVSRGNSVHVSLYNDNLIFKGQLPKFDIMKVYHINSDNEEILLWERK